MCVCVCVCVWLVGADGQASFIRDRLQTGGGVRVGGSSAQWVGLRLWAPRPLIIPRVSWIGHLPRPLSLFTEALSGCVLLPLFTLSLCRHHAEMSLYFNSVVNASWAPIVRRLEGTMKDLIPNPQNVCYPQACTLSEPNGPPCCGLPSVV